MSSTASQAMRDDLHCYLALVLTTGVGPVTLAALLDRFQTPQAVLKASPAELSEIDGVGVALARRLRSTEGIELADQVIDQCQDAGIEILLPSDRRFPRLLRELPDPPSVLYVRGELKPCDGLSIAIVGTRGASQYGRTQAERFARMLARAGLTIVSGLARGIDAAAHRGAIDGGGRTIAVMSSGVHEIYPPCIKTWPRRSCDMGQSSARCRLLPSPRKACFHNAIV